MALFDSIEEFKKYNSSITMSLSLSAVQSFIDDAVNKHISRSIGKELLNELLEAKATGIDSKSNMRPLLDLTQKACAHLAIASYVPFGSVLLSDSGAHVHSGNNQLPASDQKLAALRKQALDDGYIALEDLVAFLEKHLNEFKSYAESEAHKVNRSLFINSSVDFNASTSAKINAQLFASIRTEIGRIEQDSIEPILGADLISLLRSKIASNNSFSTIETKLVKHIQRALAPLTLASLIPYGMINISTNGLWDCSSGEGKPDIGRSQHAMLMLNTRGEGELETLRSFLNTNRASFSSYKAKETTGIAKINSATSAVYLM